MMLCLQIFARHKHDLIKKYSFSSGSWQPEERRSCQRPACSTAPPALARRKTPSDPAFSGTWKQNLPKPGLNDAKSTRPHFEMGFRAGAMHARSLWQHPCWNFIKTSSGRQQGCCHLWGVSWDWFSTFEIKRREPPLRLVCEPTSCRTSARRPGTVDVLIATRWFKSQNMQTQYLLNTMWWAHTS